MESTASEPPPRVLYDEARAKIQKLLDFIPPLPHTRRPPDFSGKAPFSFFSEQHLAQELSLQAVRISPSLETHLIGVFHDTLAKADEAKPGMPSVAGTSSFPKIMDAESPAFDARSIALNYVYTTGSTCPTLASTFLLHPNGPTWSNVLSWRNEEPENSLNCDAFYEDFSVVLDLDKVPQTTQNFIEPEDAELLKIAAARHEKLCLWHVFSPTSRVETMLSEIDDIAATPSFPAIAPGTQGFPNPTHAQPVSRDGAWTPWGMPMSDFVAPLQSTSETTPTIIPRRSHRLQNPHSVSQQLAPRRLPKTLPSRRHDAYSKVVVPSVHDSPKPGGTRDATAVSIIQHAWYRAVESDATFLVLHSGKSQRIGFRHRESQTLYLTRLISPQKYRGSDMYAKLHAGLFLCIIQDALNRERQLLLEQSATETNRASRGQQRQGSPTPYPPQRFSTVATESGSRRSRGFKSKLFSPLGSAILRVHPKTRGFVAQRALRKRHAQEILKESRDRPLLLLRYDEDILQSPSPSAFVRSGKTIGSGQEVEPKDYMQVVLTSEVATGATGNVHRGKLSIFALRQLECEVVVKLGYEPCQRRRLRHEAKIYSHLAASDVQGIPAFFGIFSDFETRTVALVLQYVGDCMAHRTQQGISSPGTYSDSERVGYTKILGDIHRSGVCHGDLRPANLTIDEDGQPFIIDFDRALQGASEPTRREEMSFFQGDVLGGTQEDQPAKLPTLSSRTTPSDLCQLGVTD